VDVAARRDVKFPTRLRRCALVIAAVIVLVGCSNGERKQATSPTTTDSRTATTEVARAVTTTVPPSSLRFDVPWVARPYPQYVPTVAVPTTLPLADARPCNARDVSIATGDGNGAGGVNDDFYTATNVSLTTCMLGGYPPAVLATQPGLAPVTATDGSEFPFTDPGPAANVAPGKSGAVSIFTSHDCPAAQTPPRTSQAYHHVIVTVPGGGTKTLNGTFDVVCGLVTSRFGVVEPQAVYPPQWYAGVTAGIAVPEAVDAGSTLTYVVTLTNPTRRTTVINPCPGYIEDLWGGGVDDITGHGLNCNSVHQILPSGRIRYEMRLAVPKNAPAGDDTLQWMISGPDAPAARVTVRVRG
jgi:hypothetical protein